MTRFQATSMIAAALMTLAVFTGTGALAGQEARQVAAAHAVQQVAAVQHVTIVGRRPA